MAVNFAKRLITSQNSAFIPEFIESVDTSSLYAKFVKHLNEATKHVDKPKFVFVVKDLDLRYLNDLNLINQHTEAGSYILISTKSEPSINRGLSLFVHFVDENHCMLLFRVQNKAYVLKKIVPHSGSVFTDINEIEKKIAFINGSRDVCSRLIEKINNQETFNLNDDWLCDNENDNDYHYELSSNEEYSDSDSDNEKDTKPSPDSNSYLSTHLKTSEQSGEESETDEYSIHKIDSNTFRADTEKEAPRTRELRLEKDKFLNNLKKMREKLNVKLENTEKAIAESEKTFSNFPASYLNELKRHNEEYNLILDDKESILNAILVSMIAF